MAGLPDLSRKAGVVTGDDVRKLFEYARKNKFAIPAINVTSSSTVVATLEAARNLQSPIILQMSSGGSQFIAGKGLKIKDGGPKQEMIQGSIAAAHFIRSIAPSYEIPVILHTDHCHPKDIAWLDGLLEADIKHNNDYHEQIAGYQALYSSRLAKYKEDLASAKDATKSDIEAKIQALSEKFDPILKNYNQDAKEPLFSSHMIDFSEMADNANIEETKKRLQKSKEAGTWLEMEIGITGGEEDGVDNEKADRKKLYTNPQDIWGVYQSLSEVSPDFSIAAAFGNVHGVYTPGAVKLRPWLLGKHQKYVKAKLQNPTAEDIPGAVVPDKPDDMDPTDDSSDEDPEKKNPIFLVFHGGSGSAKEEFQTGIKHGVVKVNIDTDTQFSYTKPVRDWMVTNEERLELPVGTKKNPKGEPNKKLFDPRAWLREGEKGMKARVEQALKDFNADGKWSTS